jgi:hypothetical protein
MTRPNRVMSDRHILVSDITLKWNLGLYNRHVKLHARNCKVETWYYNV